MLKFEWPLINPENKNVKRLSKHVFDIDEYIVDIAKKEGLIDGLKSFDDGIMFTTPAMLGHKIWAIKR